MPYCGRLSAGRSDNLCHDAKNCPTCQAIITIHNNADVPLFYETTRIYETFAQIRDSVEDPYNAHAVLHPLWVVDCATNLLQSFEKMEGFPFIPDEVFEQIAIYHDYVEDFGKYPPSWNSLDPYTQQGILALTRREEDSYTRYILRVIEAGPHVALIKLADVMVNISTIAGKHSGKKLQRKLKKYVNAQEVLLGALLSCAETDEG